MHHPALLPILVALLLLITPLYAASPYFYISPRFEPPVSADLSDHFHQSFRDCLTLARFVAATFDECDDAYQRYFPRVGAPLVKHVFQTIANIELDKFMDAADVANVLSNTAVADMSPRFSDLLIKLGIDNTVEPKYWDFCTARG